MTKHSLLRWPLLSAFIASALIGLYLLDKSLAQTSTVAIEAETGSVTSAAVIQSGNDAQGASNGRAVKFGTAVPGTRPVKNSGGCTSNGMTAPCIGANGVGAGGWGVAVFQDEFDGTALNTDKWAPDWFGGGVMNDVATNRNNVSVSDGKLVLTLSSSSQGALVSTNPNGGAKTGFQFTTGYYAEASVYFPGDGTQIHNWPAWWTDGQNWPRDGEIDIAEGLGPLTSNYHSNSGANNSNAVAGVWSNNFHTYGVDRQPGKNSIYWDGKLIRTYNTDDNGSPHYFILNVGKSGQNILGAGSQMKVDYVRAWRK